MNTHYEDWADWAGDNTQQAESDLHKGSTAQKLGLSPSGIDYTAPEGTCDLEGHEWHFGVCLICEDVVEDYEPTDAQIPGTYEIGKAAA